MIPSIMPVPLMKDAVAGLIDVGAKIIEQLASKQENLSSKDQDHDVHENMADTYRVQYLLMRITLVRGCAIKKITC